MRKKKSDFSPTMLAFLEWSFRTLEPELRELLFAGRSVEEAAEQVFGDIIARVRGNRSRDLKLYAGDYRAIMDRIAALHLRTRHGEGSVSETTVS